MTFGSYSFPVSTHEPVTKAHILPRNTASYGKGKGILHKFQTRRGLAGAAWKRR